MQRNLRKYPILELAAIGFALIASLIAGWIRPGMAYAPNAEDDFTITGEVVDTQEQPIAGASVSAYQAGNETALAITQDLKNLKIATVAYINPRAYSAGAMICALTYGSSTRSMSPNTGMFAGLSLCRMLRNELASL